MGWRGVVIFVLVEGIGPIGENVPKAPAGKLKLTSFSNCDPKIVPLNEGSRLVLTSAICHFDLSISSVAILSERLLETARWIASSRVSNGETRIPEPLLSHHRAQQQ